MKRIFTHIGFSFALTLFVLNIIPFNYVNIFSSGLAVIFIASLVLRKFRNSLAFPLCFGSALFACLVFITVYKSAALPALALDGKEAYASFYVCDLPQKTSGGYYYFVKTNSIMLNGAPQSIKLKLFTDDVIRADSYQLITAKLSFEKISSSAFSSKGYWGKGVYLISSLGDYKVQEKFVFSPMRALLHFRHDIVQTLVTNIKGKEGDLAVAVLIGDKSRLSSDVNDMFKWAGASHLMAVSGLHLTVVISFAFYILTKLKFNRKKASLFVLFLIFIYAALAGFSGSVVRASIMMTVLLFGELINKRSDTLNSLGIAVFIIFLNPFAVSDIGTDLSILSVLSMITLYPQLYKLNHILSDYSNSGFIKDESARFAAYLKKGITISFCVTMYTLPIMYLFFGYVSFNSLMSNLIVVPLGGASTIMSLITYLCCSIGIFPVFVSSANRALNSFIISIVRMISNSSSSTFFMGKYFGIVIAGALVIIGVAFILNKKRLIKLSAVVSVFIIFVSLFGGAVYESKTANIYIGENSSVIISYNGRAAVYGLNSIDYYSVKTYMKTHSLTPDLIINNPNSEYYTFLLSKEFGCDKIVSAENSSIFKSCRCNSVVISSNYSYIMDDEFNIEYFAANDYNYFKVNIFSKTFFLGNSLKQSYDISVINNSVYDYIGKIDLSNSPVIYSVTKNTIEARRLGVWLD